jgi:hypothetical protein
MNVAYLGPALQQGEIESQLTTAGANYVVMNDDEMIDTGATALAEGKALGWVQGRMEFGPRALGGRSILGDPRSPAMQKTLNLKVKYRESFRPFAPSVLVEDVSEWFELGEESPYMLLVAGVRGDRCFAMTDEQQHLFGIDKLNVPRSEIPRRHPRRLFGADSDRQQANQLSLSRTDQPLWLERVASGPLADQRRPVVNIASASPSDGFARQRRSAIAPLTQQGWRRPDVSYLPHCRPIPRTCPICRTVDVFRRSCSRRA